MSSYVYPASLPGLAYDSVRSPEYKTGNQEALSGKESRIGYRLYPRMKWSLTYEVLRNSTLLGAVAPEVRAYQGLFMAMRGALDTFLYSDPEFNTVAAMQFAVTDGTAGPYQITATYQNAGGPGGAELVQNFNGTPSIYVNGTLQAAANYSIDGSGLLTFTSGHIPASNLPLTWSGSFYYRARFVDDYIEFNQFMKDLWELKAVGLKQVKL